jgi:hypothetical protein
LINQIKYSEDPHHDPSLGARITSACSILTFVVVSIASTRGPDRPNFSDHLQLSIDRTSASLHAPASHPPPTMASLSIPRFLLPRQPLLRPSRFTQALLPTAHVRHVSSPRQLSAEFERRRAAAASTKQKVMPQPDAYRAPSHGKTIRRADAGLGKVYGPKLSEQDRKRMATKKYPNMMSPEGTFSHWFLNNRVIHLWITMVRWIPSSSISLHCLDWRIEMWDGMRWVARQ